MTTLAAVIHDFGLVTYDVKEWRAMDSAAVQQEILAMPPNSAIWWGRALMIILSNQCGDIEALRADIRSIPEWLIGEARGLPTYLAMIPLDIFNIVMRYLSVMQVQNRSYQLSTLTYLYGELHSFDDRPAISVIGLHSIGDYDEEYQWYTLGRRARARGPHKLQRKGNAETAVWYFNGKLSTVKQRLTAAISDDFSCAFGDGSALDREFTSFWAALRDMK